MSAKPLRTQAILVYLQCNRSTDDCLRLVTIHLHHFTTKRSKKQQMHSAYSFSNDPLLCLFARKINTFMSTPLPQTKKAPWRFSPPWGYFLRHIRIDRAHSSTQPLFIYARLILECRTQQELRVVLRRALRIEPREAQRLVVGRLPRLRAHHAKTHRRILNRFIRQNKRSLAIL